MAVIVIKDLADSIDLDREAMVAITGGARVRGRQSPLGRTSFRGTRLVDLATGTVRTPGGTQGRSPGGTPLK
jgi:hypothetical protein